MHSRPTSNQYRRAETLLRAADENARLHAPANAPELCIDAAMTGSLAVRWVAAMCADRLEEQIELPDFVVERLPSGERSEDHWSMDLMMGFLPDLRQRVQHAMEDDPLAKTLDRLAGDWPLSCGMSESTNPTSMRIVKNNPCLAAWFEERHGAEPQSIEVLEHWINDR